MTAKKAIKNWHIGKIFGLYPVSTGIFNETHIARSNTGVYVLQRLHPLISRKGPTENYLAASVFLASKNLPAQRVILTKRGNLLAKDGDRFWRLLTAIPGHVYNKAKNIKMVGEAGMQLGKFHALFKSFRGQIKKPLPMFQYDNVLKNLRRHSKEFFADKNIAVREAAKFLLAEFPKNFLPKNLPRRLIHTDPKISNFIFDDKDNAVAMIDMDTIQYLSPLYDLGDALRSFCGKKEDDPKNKFDIKKYKAFLAGYKKSSGSYLGRKEWQLIRQATGLVILGLATRFLNDYVDDFYFGWNPKKYKSRKEHNLARALGQIALYKDFRSKVHGEHW
ncbi:MAG: phosphotransferase [Patescibacteria group bacterium]|nr:phosphotransferase [Patescibacteria group bacterium]MDE2014999.1 phosphotransferase [Patescibacteria group bacterium]MDE2226427.1 phosphotransferase [Patescibacteria group bacterium]